VMCLLTSKYLQGHLLEEEVETEGTDINLPANRKLC